MLCFFFFFFQPKAITGDGSKAMYNKIRNYTSAITRFYGKTGGGSGSITWTKSFETLKKIYMEKDEPMFIQPLWLKNIIQTVSDFTFSKVLHFVEYDKEVQKLLSKKQGYLSLFA